MVLDVSRMKLNHCLKCVHVCANYFGDGLSSRGGWGVEGDIKNIAIQVQGQDI